MSGTKRRPEIFSLCDVTLGKTEEERDKHDKLVDFVKFAYREITRLIERGGNEGEENGAQNQEELPTTEEEMVAVLKQKICELSGLFRKLEERNENLESKLMERNRWILRFFEKSQEKRKSQEAAPLPGSSGYNSSVSNVEAHEEEVDEENQVVDVESVEPHAGEVGNFETPEGEVGNFETPEGEVDNGEPQEEEGNGEHQEFVVLELDKFTDADNQTSNPEAETLVNSMSQHQQQSSSQHVNEGYEEEEDDDVIIIEPDIPLSSPPDAKIQSQWIRNTPPKIKVEPSGILRPPRKRHTRDVTKRALNRFYCTCGIRFTSRAKFEPHIRFWKGGYLQDYKGTHVSDQSHLGTKRRARRLPRGDGDCLFPCDLCDIRFPRLCTLKNHKMIKHDIVVPGFQIGCRTCGIVFSSRSDFSRHWRSVHFQPIPSTTATTPQPSTSSTMCGSTTSKNPRSITSMKPAKITSKRSGNTTSKKSGNTTSKSNGLGHQLHHVDRNKPALLGFFCVCQARFPTQSDLDKHISSLTGKKRWPCKICGYNFKSSAGLKNHFNGGIHKLNLEKKKKAQVTPYNCSCGKKFFHKEMLDKHYRSHFPRKIYRCVECGMKFYKEGKLGMHMKTVHKIDLDC